MEYRQLGSSGLRVPALSFGTGTFGGRGPLFSAWGQSDAQEARRLVDICLDAGVTLFDTADVYSTGVSEEILGEAIRGRRDAVLVSTKTGLPMGDGPQDWGASRGRLIAAVEASLRRLGTDHIDLLQLHAFDASTPAEASAAENHFQGALKSLFAVAEAYPQLQANQNFLQLQAELVDTEDKIQASRRFYNGGVRELNTKIKVFPNTLFVRGLGFTEREFFEVAEPSAIAEAPRVQF